MNPYRFHIPNLPHQPSPITLPEDQAHHLPTLLRLQEGHTIPPFHGQGSWALATLTRVSKNPVTAQPPQPLTPHPPPTPPPTPPTSSGSTPAKAPPSPAPSPLSRPTPPSPPSSAPKAAGPMKSAND